MAFSNLARKVVITFILLGFISINSKTLANTDAWNGTVLRPNQGSGTKDNPYLITSAEEFAFLLQNYDYNSGVCIHKYYKLTCDIDMQACLWTYGTAGTENKSFRAHFDGDGHKISNLFVSISNSNTELNLGVFPMLGGDEEFESVIENLEIDGITYEFSSNIFNGKKQFNIGGLVGQMYRNSRIENCIVNGLSIKSNNADLSLNDGGYIRIGGLVGNMQEIFGGKERTRDNESIIIKDCYGLGSADLASIKGSKNSFAIELEQGLKSEDTHNGIKWHKMQNNRYSFFPTKVEISEGQSDASGRHFKATIKEGQNAKIRWTIDGKEHPSNSSECTVPFDVKDRSIAVELIDNNGKVIGSDAELVQPADLKLTISSTKNGNSYVLKSKIIGEGENALANEFTYSWVDMSDGNKIVGSSATLTGAKEGHTYHLTATHRRWKFCAISSYYSYNNPIFVNLHGIYSDSSQKYTIDGKATYKVGDDKNDGRSPETAIKTLKRAYELLQSAQIGNNIIVIMGDYDQNVFNTHSDSNYAVANPSYFVKDKPAIITGQYGNLCNGRLLMSSKSCVIDADSRFENITLHGQESTNDAVYIMAQENNLTFGHGIMMDNYERVEAGGGLIDGSFAPNFTIYGGFRDLNAPEKEHKENCIKLLSGYYGRVIAGGYYTQVNENTGNVTGTPRTPIRTKIIADICNHKNPLSYTFDIGLTVAGQSNGSCYAVTSIDISGTSRVGRAVGGNISYGRQAWVTKKDGTKSGRPSDSFFGQSIINISGGNINEIYGTSLGRSGKLMNPTEDVTDSIATYFYGKSVINISNGMVRNTIYGAGGGSVTGLSLEKDHHTFDPFIPYNLNNGDIAYGPFEKVKNKMPKVVVSSDSLVDLNKSTVTINISDKALLRGSVYGGGYGFSNHIYTSMALSQSGNLFGDSYINVTGGTIDGYIFGGGRGTTSYFDDNDLSGYPTTEKGQQNQEYFSKLALVYGSTNVNITGGTVKGMVYAGGEGTYYRPASDMSPTNCTTFMGSVIGSAHVHVGGDAVLNDFIFGGGNYGNILRSKSVPESGSCYITIDGGKIQNSIFGGGHGHVDRIHPERSILAEIEGDTYVTINGGEFEWNNEPSRYDTIRYYGIFGSGLTASIVHGNSYIEAHKSLLSQDFLDAAKIDILNYDKPWDKRFTICGGGFGEMTDIMGNANVLIDVEGEEGIGSYVFGDNAKNFKQKTSPKQCFLNIFGGGLMGNIEGSTLVTIKGNPYIRNVYGGSLIGNIGLYDMSLNGDIYSPNEESRFYYTNATIDFISGCAHNVFGGALMGNICGETFVNIGSADTNSNGNIHIGTIYGGNDVTGTIAGSNNPNYGTNINILGGTIHGDVYGSGNGQYGQYDKPSSDYEPTSLQNASTGREHPHVASASINISGTDSDSRANILGSVFVGGNNSTIGQFVRDTNDRPQFGQLREMLVPNSGRARINIGNHVSIGNLIMGSNGAHLLDYIQYYTIDGTIWTKGYETQEDFEHFCRTVDMSCVPLLTFNSDRSYSNEYSINDLYGNQKIFDTGSEMDSKDVIIGEFIGGGYCGSMTADSVYNYTLPIGVTITGDVIGGCQNAYFSYVETQGDNIGEKREYIGGFLPYNKDSKHYHRLQLNLFCKFAPIKKQTDKTGESYFTGSTIYGGCYDFGVIQGAASINLHSDMIGSEYSTLEELSNLASQNIECCQIYGGGKGVNTEVIGNTYVSLSGAIFNGEKTIPNLINVYGGSMEGLVIGKSNVVCDFQVTGSDAEDAVKHGVWNKVYGGGRLGDVVAESKLLPGLKAPAGVGTTVKVYSGQINEVFGGAHLANIEGGSFVEINDKSHNHFHTIINRVYGGSDVSGKIGIGSYKNSLGEEIKTNTYIRIAETPEEPVYSGFPLIGEVFAGGNGNYGVHGQGDSYVSGEIFAKGNNISLAGKEYPNTDMTYLDITGGTCFNVFGGANNCLVRKETTININYKDSDASAKFDRTASTECFARGKEILKHIDVKEGYSVDDYLIKTSYNIHRLFGGNNQMDMTIQPKWNLRKGHVGTIYGGCNNADAIYYNASNDRNIHHEISGNVGLTLDLDYDDFRADNVFGGCRMGNVQARKIENGKSVNVTFANNQYGTVVNVRAGKYGRIFGGNDVSGKIYNGTHIQLEGGEVEDVYGAGNGEYIYQYSQSVSEITECYDENAHKFFYQIPASKEFGGAGANDFQKLKAIENYRPNIAKSFIEIAGGIQNGTRKMVKVNHAIYGGGNCATVTGRGRDNGQITLHIGDYCTIENLYLGSNGAPHIDEQYISDIIKYNNMGSLAQTDENGRTLLDHHMDAVIMHGLPQDFQFHRNYEKCYIGSFFMGGNRGSLSTHGNLSLEFPRSLKIRDKIVGGSNRADVILEGVGDNEDLIHLGGILWDGKGTQPKIDLIVNCKFEDENGIETSAQVYPGCYQSGKVEGEVNVTIND